MPGKFATAAGAVAAMTLVNSRRPFLTNLLEIDDSGRAGIGRPMHENACAGHHRGTVHRHLAAVGSDESVQTDALETATTYWLRDEAP